MQYQVPLYIFVKNSQLQTEKQLQKTTIGNTVYLFSTNVHIIMFRLIKLISYQAPQCKLWNHLSNENHSMQSTEPQFSKHFTLLFHYIQLDLNIHDDLLPEISLPIYAETCEPSDSLVWTIGATYMTRDVLQFMSGSVLSSTEVMCGFCRLQKGLQRC